METKAQSASPKSPHAGSSQLAAESGILPSESEKSPCHYPPGATVIYGLHGRCSVVAVQDRSLNGETVSLYRLEIQKSSLSRSQRPEPAIWVPTANAAEKGLRAPMNQAEAATALSILANREYYFSVLEPWSNIQPQLENMIRKEGGIGLAKAWSYLFVRQKKQVVPVPEIARFQEVVVKMILRELSEVLGETPKVLESRIIKSMRQKLTADH